MDKGEEDEGWSGRAGDEAPSWLGLGAAARVPAPWGAGQQKIIISLLLASNGVLQLVFITLA